MKTAREIIDLIRSYRDGYAAQDNIQAARTAKAFRRLLDEVEGREPVVRTLPAADATTPDLEELRRKYLPRDQS